MLRCLGFAISLAYVAVVSPADAQTPAPAPPSEPAASSPPAAASDPPPAPAPPPRAAAWYGWQTLLADGAAMVAGAVVATTHESDASKLGLFAGTWYGVSLIAAPAVHYAHGRTPAGLVDLPMRAIAPPLTSVFGLITACLANSEFDGDCVETGMAIGSIVGSAGAAAFDALLLARPDAVDAPSSDWYGLSVLAIDALALAAGAYYATTEPRTKNDTRMHPAIPVWVMHYVGGFIGAPIVHFVHGEMGRGFGSLGLRLFAGPPAGALFGLMGFCAATAGADDCAEDGALWGLVGGGLVVAALDAFALARRSAPEPEAKPKAQSFGVTLGAGTLGLYGRW